MGSKVEMAAVEMNVHVQKQKGRQFIILAQPTIPLSWIEKGTHGVNVEGHLEKIIIYARSIPESN